VVSGSSVDGRLCLRHSHDFRIRVSDDVGFHGYWLKDKYYLIEIDLLLFDIAVGKVASWFLHGLVFEGS